MGDRDMADDSARRYTSIGVLTSGGDAPGMNAAIRAVVRTGNFYGLRVFGIHKGFQGLLRGEMELLTNRSVSETLQRGGTFLQTARSKEFMTEEGMQKAIAMARVFGVEVVAVIGGDGSYRGALDLAHRGLPVIGLPGTIDNDIGNTEYTIGYDTAMNTAMQAIDKLRDTASSHERCSVIELMGRGAGYIAHNVGMACGAEIVLIPEQEVDFERDVLKAMLEARNRGKKHYIVIVAEGKGDAIEIAAKIEAATGIEARATILGHVQRGGSPTLRDRVMASLMGVRAVECVAQGRVNRIVSLQCGRVVDLDLDEAMAMKKTIDEEQLRAAHILSL